MGNRVEFIVSRLRGKVLDVGCSACTLHEEIKKHIHSNDLFGVDIEIKKENEHYKNGSAEAIPFPDKQFDVVVAGELIEHLKEPGIFLKEAKRVLRQGGMLILTTPNRESWLNRITHSYETEIHFSLLNRELLVDLLEKNGFRVIEFSCFPYTEESSEGSKHKSGFIIRKLVHYLVPKSLQEEMAVIARK